MEGDLEVVSGGSTAQIKLRAGGSFVEKVPYPDAVDTLHSIRDLRREYNAYGRLPQHPLLLQLHSDSTRERLVLMYLRNGCLRTLLRTSPISSSQRLQFAADAAEGLSILHSVGIIHGDINPWNFLITDDFRLCIIDFSGSTIDDEAGSAFKSFRYCLPRPFDDPSTVRTDLFALGSLFYEIVTNEGPYARCEDEEVVGYFEKSCFPATQNILLGKIILGCWQVAYDTAESVHKDVCNTIKRREKCWME